MARYILLALAFLVASAFASPNFICTHLPFELVDKDGWGGNPPSAIVKLGTPVKKVVIHHTLHPPECFSKEECSLFMRNMQSYHMNQQGWDDIGYNFGIGGDFAVYEGRGWERVGAHAMGHNEDSIGIALIGDFTDHLPPQQQIDAAKQLIQVGLQLGYISEDYIVLGHRQVGNTLCPGETFYAEISTWDRFASWIDPIPGSKTDNVEQFDI